jgi:hypothetical protein
MPLEDKQWVALNLPKASKFSKNGIVLTIDQAINYALEETQNDAGENVRERAVALLLRMLAADYPFEAFQAGSYQYTRAQLLAMADDWEAKAAGGTSAGSLTSVPAVFGDECDTDEYAAEC